MDPLIWVVFALEAVGAVFFGLWLGERRSRVYIENWQQFGNPTPLQKAVMVHPLDAETRIEQAIDAATGSPNLRVVRQEDAPPAHDPRTIENGVAFLLNEARLRGEQLSEEEARDEAIRMLNAEGTEMS
jgi:hypothetical protein